MRYAVVLWSLGSLCACGQLLGADFDRALRHDATRDGAPEIASSPADDAGQVASHDARADRGGDALGANDTTATTPPTPEVHVAMGDRFTCASKSGAVKCWGTNVYGQLAQPATVDASTSPIAVALTTSPRNVFAGDDHVCALGALGEVDCWGLDDYGQVGTPGLEVCGNVPCAREPWRVPITGARQIALGTSFSCALVGTTTSCWGANSKAQLGRGATSAYETAVLASSALPPLEKIAAGAEHACGVTNNGGVMCWGHNGFGQRGDGTHVSKLTPTTVVGLSNAVDVACGRSFACALTASGTISCWGVGDYGNLGNGAFQSSDIPVPVSGIGAGATRVVAGNGHTCAIVNDRAKCWGDNTYGALGTGNTTDSAAPLDVTGLGTVVDLAARSRSTCAVTTSGDVACWGEGVLAPAVIPF